MDWKKAKKDIKAEHDNKGFAGRFGAGLPRINDGSLLFLQHMISKMKQDENGSRIAIVFNGSPLFTGSAGSGESEIRRWIIENDWLEAIVALPDQLFYNTGISTYVWILANRKAKERKGKIQLINATGQKDEEDGVEKRFWKKMSRSLGNKLKEVHEDAISLITRLYGDFEESEFSKIYPNEFFGYRRITVEQPLMEDGKPVTDKKGKPKRDKDKKDYENVPLLREVDGKTGPADR